MESTGDSRGALYLRAGDYRLLAATEDERA